MPKWLNTAVFYEIYPQSFYDTNSDGIGDINGITEKLDYIKNLGCNALWLNPCFDSPFKDAGYDVRDYKKVAERYGTNDDLVRLFNEAHNKGIRVLLDLVPGHTSEEHPWFRESQKVQKNEYSNRYIWAPFRDSGGFPYIAGESERSNTYIINFFKSQPALNYGFFNPEKPWQLPIDHPDCIATREAMKDVMRFWLDAGCDGFRVDMAGSLVKNDNDRFDGTCAIWRNVRKMLDAEYPEAALVAEWGTPGCSLKNGFHMDFYLPIPGSGIASLMRGYGNPLDEDFVLEDSSYFNCEKGGDVICFLEEYLSLYNESKTSGHICFITGNHDVLRPSINLTQDELKLAYAFLFTMPGVPFLYYGDEIGMRYQSLPTKEGGYYRTGSRTPMQWNASKNLGFSSANTEKLYLPMDTSIDAPTVSQLESDPNSLLNTVKQVLALRNKYPDLAANAPFEVVAASSGSRLFAWRRGNLVIAVNPGNGKESFHFDAFLTTAYVLGSCTLNGKSITLAGQSFVILELHTSAGPS